MSAVVKIGGGQIKVDGVTISVNGSDQLYSVGGGGGSGTVTSVAWTTSQGVSASISNPTTTPNITITLGAITPTSVNGITLSGSGSLANSGVTSLTAFTGSGTSSGTNTGDQTITLTGNVTGSGTGSFATTIANGVVTNAMLVNSSLTIGSTAISLGGTSTVLAGLTSVTSTTFVGALTGNASTATTLATARNINGVSFNGSAGIAVQEQVLAQQGIGSVIFAQTMPMYMINTSRSIISQRVHWQAVWLTSAQTLTGVKWFQVTQGNYTANNYNGIGLYTYSGGTMTKVASSTDDGNIWKATGTTYSSKAFSGTYVASAGLYYIAYMYSSSAQVTAPAIGMFSINSGVASGDFTNSAKLFTFVSSLTALPATQAMSGGSAGNDFFYGGLY